MMMNIKTTLVNNFARSKAGITETKTVLHSTINVFVVTDTLFNDVNSFTKDSSLNSVADEAKSIFLNVDRFLANL